MRVALSNLPADKIEPGSYSVPVGLQAQRDAADVMGRFFEEGELVEKCLAYVATQEHIMDFTRLRALTGVFSLMNKAISTIIEYNSTHDFAMPQDRLERYITNRVAYALMWGFGGSLRLSDREAFARYIQSIATTPMPAASGNEFCR